jgi:hypothetical protein
MLDAPGVVAKKPIPKDSWLGPIEGMRKPGSRWQAGVLVA